VLIKNGKQKNEMAAVHLMNCYCLSSLIYACETWSLKASSVHSANVALNNFLDKFLIVAGEKGQRCCYFTVVCCQLYTMSTSIIFFSTKSVTAVLYSGFLQKFVILKFCQLQTSIIFIVWTCMLARSDDVSGRYLRTV